MARDDPFAGLRLSEQTATAKLDQRLFAPEKPAAPSAMPPSSTKAEKPKSQGDPPPPGASTKTVALKVPTAPLPRFDLTEEPLYKASFVFTQGELEGLEDLKLELKRQLDTKVTKNNLIRAALHMLLEDHSTNAQRSYASRKIRKNGT